MPVTAPAGPRTWSQKSPLPWRTASEDRAGPWTDAGHAAAAARLAAALDATRNEPMGARFDVKPALYVAAWIRRPIERGRARGHGSVSMFFGETSGR